VKKGFTLIELLIVVAIIAILAAIAVPNFLEAQVRSKVSRVKADQRSLATGIEAYFVDNNQYPAAAREGSGSLTAGANTGVAINPTGAGNINRYVTADTRQAGQLGQFFSFAARGTTQLATLTTPVSYITSYFPDPFMDTKAATFGYFANPNGWILWSPGPDKVYDLTIDNVAKAYDHNQPVPSSMLINLTFDPSNGTVSGGDIYRCKE
jgi:prepilin-type N-terminal cleavage/methylation domain-containing protein